ncbi:MAG: tripartite tricarboxylate transporter TctB family protein [Desulfopila sp.]
MNLDNNTAQQHLPSKLRDRIGGGLMVAAGAFISIEALNYSFGTIARMGPGLTPFGLGVILAITGILIFIFAQPVQDNEEAPRFRPVILPLAGILAFALLVERAGLVPATLALVFISGVADPEHTLKSLTGLFFVLLLLVWVVFVHFIGVPFRMIVGI